MAKQILSITPLFAGTKRPVSAAVSTLTPHVRQIHSQWVKLLKERFKLDAISLRVLSGLKLETQYENLRVGDFNAYAATLERQGRLFENRSISIELGVAALVCYFEVCLPYLPLQGPKAPVSAFARFIWASQLAMMRGFSEQYQERRQQLEQSLRESEQHFRRFSVHVVGLYEQTGRRIARDLHDEIGHNLLVLKLYLELMSVDLKAGHSEQISQKIEEAVGLIAHAIDGVRRLAFNLGPAILEEAGLIPTLKRYASQFTERTGIKVQFHFDVGIKLPSIYEVTLYRVLQGTLSNVVAHAQSGKCSSPCWRAERAVVDVRRR